MAVAVAELWFMDVYGRYNELVFMGFIKQQTQLGGTIGTCGNIPNYSKWRLNA